jgi:predicted O-linked N-acetylglucosamine transferase (SPINDLY family)
MPSIIDELAFALRCHESGDLARAEQMYRQIAGQILNSLGIVSAQQGKTAQATASFRQALAWLPRNAPILSNLGNALRLAGELDEAVECYRAALAIHPNYPDAANNCGLALLRQGKVAEARRSFEDALRQRPQFAMAHSNLLLALNYDPSVDLETLFSEHRRYESMQAPPQAHPAHANVRDLNKKLRIGYVSPDLCEHVVAYFLAPIFANHDPEQFEVYGYAEVPAPDQMTARLQSRCRGWRFSVGVSDSELAEQIRRDGIDILVDLAGHTGNNRLPVFARRPAPVQVSYLGYPNTTGLSSIDYVLTDGVTDAAETEQRYTEEPVRLPGCFCVYKPPDQAPEVTALPAERTGRLTFGSLNDLAKLNGEVLDVWARVLQGIHGSRLLIVRHTLHGSVRKGLAKELAERGIDLERVELRHELDASTYLNLYGEIDMALDVWPWNGHVTTCEALWMGVPVLTLAGDRRSARLSASMLMQIGLPELVARTANDYVAKAKEMAQDLRKLAGLRAGLRDRVRQHLCNGRVFTGQLEAAYRSMWQSWCRNKEASGHS